MSGQSFRKVPVSPLGQFFACYLGQDWPMEFPEPWSAVGAYVSSEPLEARLPARTELTALLALPLDDVGLRSSVDRLGLNYRPEVEGTTYREWLTKVEQYLADHES